MVADGHRYAGRISGEPLPVQRPADQRLRGRRHRPVLNADAQWSPFSPGFTAPMNRPTIGPVTKADLAEPQRISLVAEWLTQAGAQQIFITSALNNSGLDAVLDFLNSKEPLCLTK